ncbi:hypothetical protein A6A04_02750 [Paramagnetospirillum marisnigri]|uniref:Uncharacterized protein n=2 Tax=Paramagnetospirillum marisnigri TaxID=1285242 RepID=A0A178MQN6_9PROT|nr:hypothetical protein A6A04_02750 [Paramagnetospirillum marisnigri]
MTWAGLDQFGNLSDSDIENHSSTSVQERLKDCSGTYKQRYECKENIVIKSTNNTFYAMFGRLAIVVVPPIILATALHMLTRRRSDDDGPNDDLLQEHHRRHHRRRSSGRH